MLLNGDVGRLDSESLLSSDEVLVLRGGKLYRCLIGSLDDINISGNTISDGTNGININDAGTEEDGVNVNGTV